MKVISKLEMDLDSYLIKIGGAIPKIFIHAKIKVKLMSNGSNLIQRLYLGGEKC